jgi:hypothetical protein
MQTANILVALGGDINNTVPRYGVTAAEIAMLQAIHGHDSVIDVEPAEDIEISQREERARLKHLYGNARTNDGTAHIDRLYPGAAARVFETLDELELTPEQFKATERAAAGKTREVVDVVDVPNTEAPRQAKPTKSTKNSKNAKNAKNAEPDAEPDAEADLDSAAFD